MYVCGVCCVCMYVEHYYRHTMVTLVSDYTNGMIGAIKRALRIPVVANGNIHSLRDLADCLALTGKITNRKI
jgi:tRNA-dihydrouridine synthase